MQMSLQLTLTDATIETRSLAIFWPAPFPLLMQSSHSANLTAFKLMNHLLSCITIESPCSQFSKGNQNHQFSIDPGRDQENLNPDTLGHFPLLLLRCFLCLLGWTDHTGWEQEEKQERLEHRACSRKPSFANHLDLIFLFSSFFITLALHCAQWSYPASWCVIFAIAVELLGHRRAEQSSCPLCWIDVANDLKPRLTFMPDHEGRHVPNRHTLCIWISGRNMMYADPGDYKDTIDITNNTCKNKDHSESDGSDWHPSQWFFSQLSSKWPWWHNGSHHTSANFWRCKV